MFPEDKLEMVRIYLTGRCPLYSLEDSYDAETNSQTFQLTHKDRIVLVTITKPFFDKNSLTEVILSLNAFNLAEFIKSNPTGRVIVTDMGIKSDW